MYRGSFWFKFNRRKEGASERERDYVRVSHEAFVWQEGMGDERRERDEHNKTRIAQHKLNPHEAHHFTY